jgi:CRP-like cAMP-binding protein
MQSKSILKNILCVECHSLKKCIFSELSPNALAKISQNKVTSRYEKGQSLFFQGNPPLGLFCVIEGYIKGARTDENGKESIVRIIAAGDIMGHRAIFSDECHCATTTALEKTLVCFFYKKYIIEIIVSKPTVALNIIRKLSVDMGKIEHNFAGMYQKKVRERLADLLILLKGSFGMKVNGKWQIDVRMSREEMASMIGVANETLIRTLSEFRNNELIDYNGKNILIIDEQALLNQA